MFSFDDGEMQGRTMNSLMRPRLSSLLGTLGWCLQKVPKRFLEIRPFAPAMKLENSKTPIQFLVVTPVLRSKHRPTEQYNLKLRSIQ